MKKPFFVLLITIVLAVLISCEKTESGPPEAILFNDTIDWQWELGEWYGGNSFYWWHYPSRGAEDLGELSTNWSKPNDFGNGRFYIRFQILEQPTDSAFKIQLGFWQDRNKEGGHSETVSAHQFIEGGTNSMIEADLGSPSTWWQLRPDAPVDFSRPTDFYQVGLALWKAEPFCIPMGQGWNNSNSCSNPEETAAEYFPMVARVLIVAVADGHSFSGWDNYP